MLPLLLSATTSAGATRGGQGRPAGHYPYAVAKPHPPARAWRLEARVALHRASVTRRAVPRLSVALSAAAPGPGRGRYCARVLVRNPIEKYPSLRILSNVTLTMLLREN